MNKILELAERYLNVEYWHTKVVSDEELEDCEIELDKAYNGLKEAIKVRKILEQTPITEEWLKEHGWEVHHYEARPFENAFHYATKMFGKDKAEIDGRNNLTIYRESCPDGDIYADCLIDEVTTAAQLYDALELCNIKID